MLTERENNYKDKWKDKLSTDKEFQKLRRKFDNFLLDWAKGNRKYERKIEELENDLMKQCIQTKKFGDMLFFYQKHRQGLIY